MEEDKTSPPLSLWSKGAWTFLGAVIGIVIGILAFAWLLQTGYNAGPAETLGWDHIAYVQAVGWTMLGYFGARLIGAGWKGGDS